MINTILSPEIRVGNLMDEGFPSVQKGKGENEMGYRYSSIMQNLKNELNEIINDCRDAGNEFTADAGTPARYVSSSGAAMEVLLQKLDGQRLAECPAVAADGTNLEGVKSALTSSAQTTYEVVDELKSLVGKESLNREAALTRLQRNIEKVAVKPELGQFSSESTQDEKRSSRYSEFWKAIAGDIASIKKEYVDFYAKLMLAYADFYQEFVILQGQAAKSIKQGSDGNHMEWDVERMENAFRYFNNSLNSDRFKNLGSVPNWNEMNEDERELARVELEKKLLPAFVVNDKGEVEINRQALDDCPKRPSWKDKESIVDIASYNAWLAAFNSMGNTFQSNLQSFSQRYTQANGTFDNLNKVLSSSITALLECAKSFLVV